MITKYEQYYNKLCDLLEEIQKKNGYPNISMAFNHWYLGAMYDLSEQEIAESIVDGKDDYGVDAIICEEENQKLTIFQFKFPSTSNNLSKEVSQSDILKTLQGFEVLRGRSDLKGENDKFEDFKKQLKGIFIEKFELVFVSFNNGVVNNKNIVEQFKENFEQESGSEMEISYIDKKIISNLFEKLTRTTSVKATIPYKICQQAYSTSEINSYMGVLDAIDLVEALKDKMLVIFDENIRLLEKKSIVNDQIKATASNDEDSGMFYFYNNGIVFICDKVANSPNSLRLNLEGASIVNGCQTVNSLHKAYIEGKLKEDVSLLFRVIEISDYDERTRITNYLNSQNSIKGSYFIANNSIIRDLQDDLLKQGYFLERQKNERNYKVAFGEEIDKDLISIELEDMIQYYSGYWIDDLAATAKRGKGSLFESNNINEILKDITSDRVVKSFKIYNKISTVITKYRKFRRNDQNTEFSNFMNFSQAELRENIDEFLFMNTADILLLNIYRNLKDSLKIEEQILENDYSDELIRNSIQLVRNVLNPHIQVSPASLTKKNETFIEARKVASNWDEQKIDL